MWSDKYKKSFFMCALVSGEIFYKKLCPPPAPPLPLHILHVDQVQREGPPAPPLPASS